MGLLGEGIKGINRAKLLHTGIRDDGSLQLYILFLEETFI